MSISDLMIPAVIGFVAVYGLTKRCRIFEAFVEGAGEGLRVVARIAPSMLGIMLAMGMLRSSGALELLTELLSPVLALLGIPKQVTPLVLLRPISGSGSLSVFKGIIDAEGPDSFAGRVASVMQGSTETTFYTIALYYGVTRVKQQRHTLAAAAAGDWAGFVMSALTVTMLMKN